MDRNNIVGLIEELDWVEPIADDMADAVKNSLDSAGAYSQPVRNFLHGTWLGHPLHPVLTDIPLGAWTVAGVLDVADLMGDKTAGAAADAAVAIGLAGALGSAVTGLADWHVLEKGSKPRKVGTVHALLNLTATALYAGSLLLRKSNKRGAARVIAALGYSAVGISAFLGGILVYDQNIGVNHAPLEGFPEKWIDVLPADQLEEGKPTCVHVGEIDVVLVRRGHEVLALANSCSHLGGPLCEGSVTDGSIACPWHQSRFDLETGSIIDGPATLPQPAFKARINGDRVEVGELKVQIN